MEIVYGINPVLEVMRARRRRCHELFISSGRAKLDTDEILDEAHRQGIKIRVLSKEDIGQIANSDAHQGVAARCEPYPLATVEDVLEFASNSHEEGLLLLLDGITDPQNFGALIRTACLLGVHGVIAPKDKSCPVSGAVVKASAGATEYARIVYVTNLVRALSLLKEKKYWIIGADGGASSAIYEAKFEGDNVALVLGSEGKGMRRLVRESCDFLYKIPMVGKISSFNVSVAGAIFMWEVARSRC